MLAAMKKIEKFNLTNWLSSSLTDLNVNFVVDNSIIHGIFFVPFHFFPLRHSLNQYLSYKDIRMSLHIICVGSKWILVEIFGVGERL